MKGSWGRLPTLIPPASGSLEAGTALGHGHEDVYGSELGFAPHFPQQVPHLAQPSASVNPEDHHVGRLCHGLRAWHASLQAATGVGRCWVLRGEPGIFPSCQVK